MKFGTYALIISVLLLAFPGCLSLSPLVEKTVTLNVAHVSSKPLRIQTANGNVEVNGGAHGEVAILATIRAVSEERLEQTTVSASRDSDGTLVIETSWPGNKRKSREGCHITVEIPDVNSVDLQSSNGKLKIRDLQGEGRLKTSNGSITVMGHRGSVNAETSNGRIELQDIQGEIDMKSSNGKLIATRVGGEVRAKTSNGSVEITLGSQSDGPVNATSSNGSITLTLSQRFNGGLDLRTSNGSVKIDDSLESYVVSRRKKKEARLKFGNGGQESRLKTSNGSIRVQR